MKNNKLYFLFQIFTMRNTCYNFLPQHTDRQGIKICSWDSGEWDLFHSATLHFINPIPRSKRTKTAITLLINRQKKYKKKN